MYVIYPNISFQSPNVIIDVDQAPQEETITLSNPKTHFETNSGFGINLGGIRIFWEFGRDNLHISLTSSENKAFFINSFRKFRSIGYALTPAIAGQIMHELVLVPLAYFFNDIAPIHCSSFVKGNKAILVGGTGGVGKTSALLSLCRQKNISFLSDDILMVNNDGLAFPNFAYPKIYAYNTLDNKDLESLLLRQESPVGKFQWNFIKRINPARVRRRISPKALYKLPEENSYSVGSYYILCRGNFPEMSIEQINLEKMSELTLSIIKAEYWTINNHIYWHEYNHNLLGQEKIVNMPKVFNNWENIYKETLANSRLNVIKIPLNLEHDIFTKRLLKILHDDLA